MPGTWERTNYIDIMNDYLVRMNDDDDDLDRLIITIAPRSGKSLFVTILHVAWYMIMHPDHYVIIACFGKELATYFGRFIRKILTEWGPIFDVHVSSDNRAADEFSLEEGGTFVACGILAVAMGRGAHLIIVDDPCAGVEDADSATMREKTWNAWQWDLEPRRMPQAKIVVISTRWHMQDLVGHLSDDKISGWVTLNFTAQCEDPKTDVLKRKKGEFIWPKHWASKADIKRYKKPDDWKYICTYYEVEKAKGARYWNALFMGRPSPEDGVLFTQLGYRTYEFKEKLGLYQLKQKSGDPINIFSKDIVSKFATVDPAASDKKTADFTVCSVWGVTSDKKILLLDMIREHLDTPRFAPMLKRAWEKWHPSVFIIESFGIGLPAVKAAREAGLTVRESTNTKKGNKAMGISAKYMNAQDASELWEAGQIFLDSNSSLLDVITDELYTFPNGSHDDIVDTVSLMSSQLSRLTSYAQAHGAVRCKSCRTAFLLKVTKICPQCGMKAPE